MSSSTHRDALEGRSQLTASSPLCSSIQDVSGLFPDVLKNMQTEDLEQKKLVYLYLINYAKTQPELVILAVNTFIKVRCADRPMHAFCRLWLAVGSEGTAADA